MKTNDKIYCIIGDEDTECTAHLLRRLLERCTGRRIGLITDSGCLWEGKHLPPPTWPCWREMLEAEVQILRAQGCENIVLTLTPKQIAAGCADGFHCGTAVLCEMGGTDCAGAVERYLTACCGALCANLDNAAVRALAARWPRRSLGYAERRPDAALNARGLFPRRHRLTFEAVTDTAIARVTLALPGSYDLYMALGALGCGLLEGVSLEEAARAVSSAPGVPGYMELRHYEERADELIHCRCTPRQLELLLTVARRSTSGRVLLVLALPQKKAAESSLRRIALAGADVCVFAAGGERRSGCPDLESAVQTARLMAGSGDLIVLAGRGDWSRVLPQDVPSEKSAAVYK